MYSSCGKAGGAQIQWCSDYALYSLLLPETKKNVTFSLKYAYQTFWRLGSFWWGSVLNYKILFKQHNLFWDKYNICYIFNHNKKEKRLKQGKMLHWSNLGVLNSCVHVVRQPLPFFCCTWIKLKGGNICKYCDPRHGMKNQCGLHIKCGYWWNKYNQDNGEE